MWTAPADGSFDLGRTFPADEVIVSKTDLRGRITYVNDVFLEVSRYREHEVIGQPHNLIRHPEMPQLVFALLWEAIQSGQEIFAYVDNLAKDGEHYWVLAHVTPTVVDGSVVGYHSNRRAPDIEALRVISPIYAQLRAAERRCSRPSEAVDAARQVLDRVLDEQDTSYDRFVWSLAGTASR